MLKIFKNMTFISLLQLPNEILHLVFGYLSQQDLIWSLSSTCVCLRDSVIYYMKTVDLELQSTPSKENQGPETHLTIYSCNSPDLVNNGSFDIVNYLNHLTLASNSIYLAFGNINDSIHHQKIKNQVTKNKIKYCDGQINTSAGSKVQH